jgi:hypothetical protein
LSPELIGSCEIGKVSNEKLGDLDMTAVVRLFDVMAAIVSFASSVHQQPTSPVESYGIFYRSGPVATDPLLRNVILAAPGVFGYFCNLAEMDRIFHSLRRAMRRWQTS